MKTAGSLHFGFVPWSVLASSATAELMRATGVVVRLGHHKFGLDGSLVPIRTRQNLGNDWFRADNVSPFGFFYDTGTMSNQSKFNESASHGKGISTGDMIAGFDLWYASDMDDGTVRARVSHCKGRDSTNTQTQAVAQFLIDLPTPHSGDLLTIHSLTVILPAELQFSFAGNDFEYGLQLAGGRGIFGPMLQANLPG